MSQMKKDHWTLYITKSKLTHDVAVVCRDDCLRAHVVINYFVHEQVLYNSFLFWQLKQVVLCECHLIFTNKMSYIMW